MASSSPDEREPKHEVHVLDGGTLDCSANMDPLKLSVHEKRELRDVSTSVVHVDVPLEWVGIRSPFVERDQYMTAYLRIQHEVKRVSFDRNVGSNGLLFFVDCLDGDQSLHIWLFIRLVFLRDEQLILVNSASGCPISVHDWSCKDCSSGRECSFDYRSVMCIDEQTLQLNIQMMEQTEDSVFLYAMTLNSLEIGSLSPSITVTKKKEKVTTPKGTRSNTSKTVPENWVRPARRDHSSSVKSLTQTFRSAFFVSPQLRSRDKRGLHEPSTKDAEKMLKSNGSSSFGSPPGEKLKSVGSPPSPSNKQLKSIGSPPNKELKSIGSPPNHSNLPLSSPHRCQITVLSFDEECPRQTLKSENSANSRNGLSPPEQSPRGPSPPPGFTRGYSPLARLSPRWNLRPARSGTTPNQKGGASPIMSPFRLPESKK